MYCRAKFTLTCFILIWVMGSAMAQHAGITTLESPFDQYQKQIGKTPQQVIDALEQHQSQSTVEQAQVHYILSEAYLGLTYPQKAKKHIDQGLSLIPEHKQPWLHHKFLLIQAAFLEFSGQPEDALPLVEKTLDWAMKQEDLWLTIEALAARGHIHNVMALSAKALEDFQAAYQMAPKSGGEINQAELAIDIALVYEYRKEDELAIPYFQESVDYHRAKNNLLDLSIALYGLGRAHLHSGQTELGKQQLQESKTLAAKVGDVQGEAYATKELAGLAIANEQYPYAIELLKEVQPVFELADNVFMKLDVAFSLTVAYMESGEYEQAQHHLNLTKSLAETQNTAHPKASISILESELLAAQGQFEQAFKMLQEGREQELDIIKQNNSEALNQLRVAFDLSQKEKENQALMQQNKLHLTEIKAQQERQKLLSLLVLFFILVMVLLFWSIYKNRKHRAKLQFLANHDGLTQLFNRMAGIQVIRNRRTEQPKLVLVMLDLDHFKQINDRYGHAVGDEVLVQFSQLCQQHLPEDAIVIRLGGEEFLLAFGHPQMAKVMQQMYQLKDLCKERIQVGQSNHQLTFSAGMTTTQENLPLETSIQQADMAMYRAKSQGRNRIIIYNES